jgi:hypothetical protein
MAKKSSEILFEKIDEGVKLAIRNALEKHQKLGESVVVYQDDEIKIFTGEDIKVLLENDNTEFP